MKVWGGIGGFGARGAAVSNCISGRNLVVYKIEIQPGDRADWRKYFYTKYGVDTNETLWENKYNGNNVDGGGGFGVWGGGFN